MRARVIGAAFKATTHAGYATILQRKCSARPDVAGVLYELSTAEMWALAAMEAGYDVETVRVDAGSGVAYEAQAFVTNWSLRLFDEAPPSQRYIGLIREGAEHHRLPAEYRVRGSSADTHLQAVSPPSHTSAPLQAWLGQVEVMFDPKREPRYFATPSGYLAAAAVSALFAGVTSLLVRPRR